MHAASAFARAMRIATAFAAAQALPCAAAEPTPSLADATAESALHSAAAASAPWLRPRPALDLRALRVVELPAEPQAGARTPKHHALSWRNDTLSRALDNAGLANSDCYNRVRLPSRWGRAPDGSSAVNVQLQVAVGCRF